MFCTPTLMQAKAIELFGIDHKTGSDELGFCTDLRRYVVEENHFSSLFCFSHPH